MTVFPRRSLRALVAFSLFVTGLVTLVSLPTAATTENPCAALRQWAAAYRDVSPSLDDLARYDRSHRIAIFNAVTPAVRASLWQEQLRRFDARPDLSATQHALIQEAATLTTPALYAREPQAVAAHQEFWSRAESEFTEPQAKRIMFDLGAAAPRYQAAVGRSLTCDCNRNLRDCGSCVYGGCQQDTGCGPTGNAMCDGVCQ